MIEPDRAEGWLCVRSVIVEKRSFTGSLSRRVGRLLKVYIRTQQGRLSREETDNSD